MINISNHFNSKSEKHTFFFRGIYLICIISIVLLTFTVLGESYDLDRRFSAQFFSLEEDWYLKESIPWNWFYDYGALPGILMSIISILLWFKFRTNKNWTEINKNLLICGFTPIVASLLLVNIILKDHTGRPRPREIIQFNGNWEYKPVLKAGIPGKGHSFPCGHCSIAFTLTSGIVFFRYSKFFAITSFSIGLSFGILMSVARIVQGGHFLSDAVWSLGVVFFTLLVFYYFIFQSPRIEDKSTLKLTKKQKWKIFGAVTLLLSMLILFIFTRRPFYKEHTKIFDITSNIKRLEVYTPKNWKVKPPIFENRKEGHINLVIQGYAPPYSTHYLKFLPEIVGETIKLRIGEKIVGYHRNFQQSLKLHFPSRFAGKISTFKTNKNNNN